VNHSVRQGAAHGARRTQGNKAMAGWCRRTGIGVAVVAALMAGPIRADDTALPQEIGGVRLSRAEAAVAANLVRHTLKTVGSDASLKRQPTHAALVHALTNRFAETWPLAESRPKVFGEPRRMQVFVTLYAPGGADLSAEGRGTSLLGAVIDAACSLQRSARYGLEGFDRLTQVRVSLDLTVIQLPYRVNVAEPFLYSMRPGLDGLVYENADQRGVVLPWEAVRRSWELRFRTPEGGDAPQTRPARTPEDVKKAVFRSLLERAGQQPTTWRGPLARVLKFDVQSFVEDRPGGGSGVVQLYRTGVPVRAESMMPDDVAAAAKLATDYLARTPDRAHRVREAYDPLRGQWDERLDPGRQAVVTSAVARLCRSAKQEWMLRATRRLSGWLVRGLKRGTFKGRDGKERPCAYVLVEAKPQMAAIAQVLVGLCEVQQTDPAEDTRDAIRLLAGTLVAAQYPDGAFGLHFMPAADEKVVGKDREDVRGESLSLLALARAFEVTGDQELLKAARAGAEYMVFRREKKLGRSEPVGIADPYLIEALAVLDRYLANDGFVRYAATCAEAIVKTQASDASRHYLDELGGFLGGTTYPDAEYSSFCLRGLKAFLRLAAAVEASAPERYRKASLALTRERASQSVTRAEAFLLGLQYTESNTFYVGEPAVALGGLRHSACDARVSTIAVANFLLAETQ